MIYIGTSHSTDSLRVGQESAQRASEQFSENNPVSWVLAFCGGRHNPKEVLDGIRNVLGNVEIYGGSTVGIITKTFLGYSGFECGVILFQAPFPKPRVVMADMKKNDFEAGKKLGIGLQSAATSGDTTLILYDNLKSKKPVVLHMASRLLDGIYTKLSKNDLNIIGAGLLGDYAFHPSFLFNGVSVVKHTALALIIPGTAVQASTTIMHGCIPVSSFCEITKIDGAKLYELDHQPALTFIADNLGIKYPKIEDMSLSMALAIGKKYGDPYAPYDENMYVNRLIVGSSSTEGSVTLFEADFKKGDKIQIMSRENEQMMESVSKGTSAHLDFITKKNTLPKLALYIDCAGRARNFSGSREEEAACVAKEFNPDIPFFGFYSGVELATFLGRSRPLDWTGILTLFTKTSAND